MSRPRLLSIVKKTKGTLQTCRENKNIPDINIEAPSPPAIVKGVALQEWKRVVNVLVERGVITKMDRSALAAYCVAYGRWYEAEKSVAEHGTMLKAPNNLPMPSPYLSVATKAMEQMIKIGGKLGLNPTDRESVRATPKKEIKPEGKERFFR